MILRFIEGLSHTDLSYLATQLRERAPQLEFMVAAEMVGRPGYALVACYPPTPVPLETAGFVGAPIDVELRIVKADTLIDYEILQIADVLVDTLLKDLPEQPVQEKRSEEHLWTT